MAMLIMEQGKYFSSEGLTLPDGEIIKEVGKKKGYKYRGSFRNRRNEA